MAESFSSTSGAFNCKSNFSSNFADSNKNIPYYLKDIGEVPEDLGDNLAEETLHDHISIFENYDKIKDSSRGLRNPFKMGGSSVNSPSEKEPEDSFSISSSSKIIDGHSEEKSKEGSMLKINLDNKVQPGLTHDELRKELPKLMLSPAQNEDGILPRPQTIFELEEVKYLSKQSSKNDLEDDEKQLKFKLRTLNGRRRHFGRSTNLTDLKLLKLGTFMKVRRFIRTLKMSSQSFKYRKLGEFHLKILDKESSAHMRLYLKRQRKDNGKEISFIMLRKKTLSPGEAVPPFVIMIKEAGLRVIDIFRNLAAVVFETIFLKVKVIEPENPFRITWTFIIIVFTILSITYFPLKIFFLESYFFYDYLIYFAINAMNMVLKFNSALYSKGHLVKSRWKIFKKYAGNKLLSDSLNMVAPLVFMIKNEYITNLSHFLRLRFYMAFLACVFLKFFDIGKMFHDAVDHIRFRNKNAVSLIKLVKLLLIVFCSAHWIGCSWFLVALYQSEDLEGTWVYKQNLNDKAWSEQYVSCLYYASVTMLTVGYGDITPVNFSEKIFSIFILFIACGLFAFTMNTIGLILSEMDRQASAFNKKVRVLNMYMEERKFDQQLQNKIRKFLTYVWKYENQEKLETPALLQMIPHSFQAEVLLAINGKIIKESKIFKPEFTNFSNGLVEKLCFLAKEVTVPPDFVIFQEKDFDLNPSMYMLTKGTLEFYLGSNNTTITLHRHWTGSDPFGHLEFFLQIPREHSAKSVDFSTFISVSRDDLIGLLKAFPLENEKFRMIHDCCLNYGNYRAINSNCLSCQKHDHLLKSCPYLVFAPSKDTVIQKYDFSVPHLERRTFTKRRKEKSKNALSSIRSISKISSKLMKKATLVRSKVNLSDDESDMFTEDSEETSHEKTSKSELKNQQSFKEDLLPEPQPPVQNPQSSSHTSQSPVHTRQSPGETHQSLTQTPPITSSDALVPVAKINILEFPKPNKRMSLMQQPKRRYSAMAPDLKRTSNPENLLLRPINESLASSGKPIRRSSNHHYTIKSGGTGSASMQSIKKIDNLGITREELEENMENEKEGRNHKGGRDRKLTERSYKKEEKREEKELQEEEDTESLIKESVVVDKVCTFAIYFPKNNIKGIIAQIEIQNQKNIQKRARRKEKQAFARKSHILSKSSSNNEIMKRTVVNFDSASKMGGHLSPSRTSNNQDFPSNKL